MERPNVYKIMNYHVGLIEKNKVDEYFNKISYKNGIFYYTGSFTVNSRVRYTATQG